MGRCVRWQQLAVGMWHVWGVHTGTCIVGCSLKQPARPPTRHTPIFRLFRKKAGFFWAWQAITQKTLSGVAGFFLVAAHIPKLGPLHAKLYFCITAQNTRFGLFWPKKGIFGRQRRGPGATWASHLLPTPIGAWGGNMVPRGAPETGLSLSPAKLCIYKAT